MQYDSFLKVDKLLNEVVDNILSFDNNLLEDVYTEDKNGNFVKDKNHWKALNNKYPKLTDYAEDFIFGMKTIQNIEELNWVKNLIINNYDEYYEMIEDEFELVDIQKPLKNERLIFFKKVLLLYDELYYSIENREYELISSNENSATKQQRTDFRIQLNFEEAEQKKLIQLMYNLLNNKLINCSFEEFENHFMKDDENIHNKKIQWHGTEPQIKYFFKWLSDKNIILETDLNILIAKNFLNKKGKNFNPKQLSVATSGGNFELLKQIPEITIKIQKLVLRFN